VAAGCVWGGGWCGVWGLVCVCGRVVGCVCVVCVCLGGGGRSPLALEHSKVCTLCDFGHLQFFFSISALFHCTLLCTLRGPPQLWMLK
jgi:hypothetical protein